MHRVLVPQNNSKLGQTLAIIILEHLHSTMTMPLHRPVHRAAALLRRRLQQLTLLYTLTLEQPALLPHLQAAISSAHLIMMRVPISLAARGHLLHPHLLRHLHRRHRHRRHLHHLFTHRLWRHRLWRRLRLFLQASSLLLLLGVLLSLVSAAASF